MKYVLTVLLVTAAGSTFAGDCQSVSREERQKCLSDEDFWYMVTRSFENDMRTCPSISKSRPVESIRREMITVKVFGKEWGALLGRMDQERMVCRSLTPRK